jgi:hypothetical protein
MRENGNQDEPAQASSLGNSETGQSGRTRRPVFGLTGIITFVLLTVPLLLVACNGGSETAALPTLIPTAVVILPTAVVEPTITPLPTATPEPLSATLTQPLDGAIFDLGQAIDLAFLTTDPIGLREIHLTANGQTVGLHHGNGATALNLNHSWTPIKAGSHRIIVTAVSRTGETISSTPITIKVIDRVMMARNAPTWARVEANVTAIRGLAPLAVVEPGFLSRLELRQWLQDNAYYSREEAQRDVLVLYSFDFAPRDFDLYAMSQKYIGESIAGFYDPATKELFIISDDKDVNALEQWIYAHEFMHALQDQHFQLALITDTSLGSEGNMALRALAEGEAELIQQLYLDRGYLSTEDLVEIFNLVQRIRSRNVGYLPPVLVNSFLFPYTTGKEFVQTLYNRGGWTAVNAAWQNLPQSSEQIIHPSRYLAGDAPKLVALAPLTDTLGAGWELIEEDVFGEFFLREYLSQSLPEAEVNVAATGWGGDRYAVYWHSASNGVVMVLNQVWDSVGDGNEFANAYNRYTNLRRGGLRETQPDGGVCWQTIDVICFYHNGAQTMIVRAPDLSLARQVAAAAVP